RLSDHRARDRGDHPHAEDAVGCRVGDDFDEAIRVAVGLGAAVGDHWALADLHLVPGFLGGFLGQADTGDLRHRIDHARDHRVVHDAGLPGDVFGYGDAFVLRLVRQHRAGDHVANRPHALDLGAEIVVRLDLPTLVRLQ